MFRCLAHLGVVGIGLAVMACCGCGEKSPKGTSPAKNVEQGTKGEQPAAKQAKPVEGEPAKPAAGKPEASPEKPPTGKPEASPEKPPAAKPETSPEKPPAAKPEASP
jgi:type IV secretory pathway VirB10-like protein